MKDFSQKYRGVTHFGLWAENGADLLGEHDAWVIVVAAVKASYDEDVRSCALEDALNFLGRSAVRRRPFDDFKDALSIADPGQRHAALKDAAERIAHGLNG